MLRAKPIAYGIILCFLLLSLQGCTDAPSQPSPEPENSPPVSSAPPLPTKTPSATLSATQSESSGSGAKVRVYTGNDLHTEAPFAEPTVIKVDQGNGRVNEITLTGEEVYMSDSTCEGHDCMYQEAITPDNYMDRLILFNFILCLPNQVTVEFLPEEAE